MVSSPKVETTITTARISSAAPVKRLTASLVTDRLPAGATSYFALTLGAEQKQAAAAAAASNEQPSLEILVNRTPGLGHRMSQVLCAGRPHVAAPNQSGLFRSHSL